MSRRKSATSFKSHITLIVGSLVATVLGALSALQFERIFAVGHQLTIAAGQEALVNAATKAGLTGFLLWVACVLLARTIGGIALRPYRDLADRLDALVDGHTDDLADLRGPVVGVRRLARAIFVFHDAAMASRRSEADLQAKYDALYRVHVEERRLLMSRLLGNPSSSADELAGPSPDATTLSEFEIPSLTGIEATPESPAPQTGLVIDLNGRLATRRSLSEAPGWIWPAWTIDPPKRAELGCL
jgi:hypothetical protein